MASLTCNSTTTTTASLTCSGAGTPTQTRYWYYTLTSSTAADRKQYGYNKLTYHDITFTGLEPGTTYYAECRYGPDLEALQEWANNGNTTGTYNGGSCYVFTEEEIVYETTDYGSCSIGTVTTTSVWVNLDYITPRSYDRTVYFHWYNTRSGGSGSPSKTLSANASSLDREMPNLTSGTQYRFHVTVVNPAGVTTYTSSYMYATPIAYDHVLTLTVTSTYNRIYVTATTNQTKSYDISVSFFLDGARELTDVIAAGETSCTRYYYTDITPATSYTVSLHDNTLGRDIASIKKRTKNNFSWTGGAKVKGATFDLTASDWNEFTTQLKAKERWFTSNQRTFTTAVTGNDFTATMFNQAVASINNMVADGATDCVTTMTAVSKGDPVTAAAMNQLVACLNE